MLSLHGGSPKITLTVPLFKLGDGVLYNLYVVSAVLLLCLFICQRQCSANTHWTLIVLISRGKMRGDILWRILPFFLKIWGENIFFSNSWPNCWTKLAEIIWGNPWLLVTPGLTLRMFFFKIRIFSSVFKFHGQCRTLQLV